MGGASHIVPALLFFALGCACGAQALKFGVSWRRHGFIRAERGGFGWAPFGDVQTAVSLLGRLGRTREENEARKHEIHSSAAICARIVVFALVAVGAFAGAYEFARFGHGFGN